MGRHHGTKDFWLASLRAEGAAFGAAVRADGVLTAQVPSCPQWTGTDLVRHVGGIYAWVSSNIARGVTTPPERRPETVELTDEALLTWWDGCFAEVLRALDRVEPEQPAWNWAPQPKRAIFWHRRLAHETAVHRWDAQLAAGLPEPVEAKLAADGVSEVMDTWLASGRRHSRSARTGVVALNASDVDQVWFVRLRGEGVALLDTDTLLDDDDRHERATAIGSASDLLLALYGRVPFDVLQVSGDVALLEGLRTG
ncbi:MAG TPA: maleylpyruvate isomerase N-terminal domain-containing protein [Micromonosporaceae bacterium]|nr:maleylpyruvate isomerase N-terminal domain-containing protein [Micromonosporaceae bacterium]